MYFIVAVTSSCNYTYFFFSFSLAVASLQYASVSITKSFLNSCRMLMRSWVPVSEIIYHFTSLFFPPWEKYLTLKGQPQEMNFYIYVRKRVCTLYFFAFLSGLLLEDWSINKLRIFISWDSPSRFLFLSKAYNRRAMWVLLYSDRI